MLFSDVIKREIVNTDNGILAVANMVRSESKLTSLRYAGKTVVTFEVHLPPGGIEPSTAWYADYLLDHPREGVECYFTKADVALQE